MDTALDAFAAWIFRLVAVMTGGMVDLDLDGLKWEVDELEREVDELTQGNNTVRQQLAEMRTTLETPKRFEAYTNCPKCGRLDYHLLRAPKPPPSDAEMRAWRDCRTTAEIHQFGRGVIRTVDTSPPPPIDESTFEVIRICKCGHEFGQI